ncbi:MAG: mechanosensitive ion channel family protein [bacterium]|nr:mechanosensitive ion channel family protein [bacterium]MDT8367323.1 mechanosensitive ion channel family protein [bacterium]
MFILERIYFGNSLLTWIISGTLAAGIYICLRLVRRLLGKRLKILAERTATDLDNFIADLVQVRTKKALFFGFAVYGGSMVLLLPANVERLIVGVVFVILFFQIGLWGNGMITFLVTRRAAEDGTEGLNLEAYSVITWMAKVALWAIVVLLALNNLGIEITALVAGLGISGIAVALALQNILGDLFAALSIVLDKPFVIGDFIIVGEQLGTVEHVGLKTTRVHSLSGEQIVFANNDLLNSRIRNYGRMNERRVLFGLGVTYQTPKDKLEKIPVILREAIEAQDQVRFDRSNFSRFGTHSLDFETVYYVLDRDYNLYMNVQEKIYLAIYERFGHENIKFAYPTQTLFVEKEG